MSFTDNVFGDNYMTYKSTWNDILKYIPKDKIIYEPFYGDGKSGEYLRELGCKNVIHEDIDFFKNNFNYDLIISNPPFSKKKEILKKLYDIDKPFIILAPCMLLSYKYFQDNFKNKIQIIIPSKRISFKHICWRDNKKYSPPFSTFYFCYKMKLKNDIIFL